MKTLVSRFVKDESGATAIEYGLIAAGISVAIVLVVQGVDPAFDGWQMRRRSDLATGRRERFDPLRSRTRSSCRAFRRRRECRVRASTLPGHPAAFPRLLFPRKRALRLHEASTTNERAGISLPAERFS